MRLEALGVGIKKGALVEGLSNEIWVAIGVIWAIFKDFQYPFVITSGKEGKHGTNSLHYSNNAFDIRTRDILDRDRLEDVYYSIKRDLDEFGFDVILEKDHIHVEWDPKENDAKLLRGVE